MRLFTESVSHIFWIYLFDVLGVGTYLFIDFRHVLSEVIKRKTGDSYCFIITAFQNVTIFMFYYVLNTIKGNFNPTFSKPFGAHTFYQGGGVGYLKNVAPMNVKFCRVLETPWKVLEM